VIVLVKGEIDIGVPRTIFYECSLNSTSHSLCWTSQKLNTSLLVLQEGIFLKIVEILRLRLLD
jgi:hypothetical protein